jgi:hypothetical protein
VRALFPVRHDAGPPLVVLGQGGQRPVDPGQVRGPPVSLGQAHPGQQRPDAELPVPYPDGQKRLDRRRDAGTADDLL